MEPSTLVRSRSERSNRYAVIAILCALLLMGVVTHAQTSRAASGQSYVERGYMWLEKGEIERALADFDRALALAPLNSEVG